MTLRRFVSVGAVVLFLICVHRAAAQTTAAPKSAAQITKPEPDALFAEGYSLLEAGNAQAAAAKFEAGLKASPQNPLAHFFLGKAYFTLEKYDLAKSHLEKSIDLDPTNKCAADAKTLLQTIAEAEARVAAENSLWATAQSNRVKAYYQSYLEKFPRGKHVSEAKDALATMASEEARAAAEAAAQAEEAAWTSAQRGERGAARAYLQQYPNGRYAAAAKAQLVVIEQTAHHALDNLPFIWDEASLKLLRESGAFQDWPSSTASAISTSRTTDDVAKGRYHYFTSTAQEITQSTTVLGPGIAEVQSVDTIDSKAGKNPYSYTITTHSFIALGGLLGMQSDQYSDLGTLDKHSHWSNKPKFSGNYDTRGVDRLTGIYGTLFPLGSGATLTIDSIGESRQPDNSTYSIPIRTSCRTLEKVPAKSISPEFSGDAFKTECRTSMHFKTNGVDSTNESISHDYFLESLGLIAGAVGAHTKVNINRKPPESTVLFPASTGESESNTDESGTTTTTRYSQVAIQIRSIGGNAGESTNSTPPPSPPQADVVPPPQAGIAAAARRPAAAKPKPQP